MKPTEILSQEHRVIEGVLDCLEILSAKARRARRLDGKLARSALSFLRTFADRCHHGKEEKLLFRAMVRKGFPRHSGPIGAMLLDHREGRGHVREMSRAVSKAATGDAKALARFRAHASAYVDLLRDHIEKEDDCIFPMADHVMNAVERKALVRAFVKVEKHHMGEGTHERYLAVAESLSKALGVKRGRKRGRLGTGGCGGCCHH